MSANAEAPGIKPVCPVIRGRAFDPMDPDQAGDQYRWLIPAQEEAPIFFMPEYDMWCVTRFDDVLWVVRDTEKFSSRGVLPNDLHPDLASIFPAGHPYSRALVNSDPPCHTRLRKALQPAFTPRAIASYEPTVCELADALIDGFIDQGECDLVIDYARKLALDAVTRMCGLPLERATEFASFNLNQLTESNGGDLTMEARRAEAQRTADFVGYLKQLIETRQAAPKEDLISYVATVETKAGPPLTTDEMIGLLFNILGASLDNTSTGISVMFREILRRPELWDEARENPKMVERVIDETLRWHDPAQAVTRITTQPVIVAGQSLPTGARIYAHYGAAQRDPRVFTQPNEFDPERDDLGRHFALGRGAHMCLGAPVARLEMRISLERFLQRIPHLRLASDDELGWNPGFVGARVKQLRLVWETNQLPDGIISPATTVRH